MGQTPGAQEVAVPLRRLTPPGGHYFFGYYDNPAWDAAERRHLCQKVEFMDRLPRAADVAQLGTVELAGGKFEPFAETTAWNFQQGAMLQWLPKASGEEVIFNRRERDRYAGVVKNIRTGAERPLSRPLANVSPDGKRGLSINFSRMYDFRPGYGYAGIPDPFAADAQPEEDGIFLVDLETGESKLLISLAQLGALEPDFLRGKKLLINHINFNPDGTRFVFLPRTFKTDSEGWRTGLYTADINGNKIYRLRPYGTFSHYHWRDPRTLLIWGKVDGRDGLYLLKDQTQEAELLDPEYFQRDGHCSFSPDRSRVLYDGYPSDDYRPLFLYDLNLRRGATLGKFYGPMPTPTDIRCDLHPRWSPSGKTISFDSVHEGARHIYLASII